jgi:hypothetical protein
MLAKQLKNVFLILILCFPFHLLAQEPEIKRERTFTGEGLYGFMNGGADLYFEYGFKTLVNRDIMYKGEAFTMDIFEMPTCNDAFGIYSIHAGRCQQADTMGMINCFSPYQLQTAINNYYVSIVFPSGSAKAQQIATELIPRYFSAQHSSQPGIPEKTGSSQPGIPQKTGSSQPGTPQKTGSSQPGIPQKTGSSRPDIPDDLAASPPFSGVIKYLRGPISVSGASRDLTAILKDTPFRGVWFRHKKKKKSYQAVILFSSSEEQEKFKQTIPASDVFRSADDTLFIRRNEIIKEPSKTGEFGF